MDEKNKEVYTKKLFQLMGFCVTLDECADVLEMAQYAVDSLSGYNKLSESDKQSLKQCISGIDLARENIKRVVDAITL